MENFINQATTRDDFMGQPSQTLFHSEGQGPSEEDYFFQDWWNWWKPVPPSSTPNTSSSQPIPSNDFQRAIILFNGRIKNPMDYPNTPEGFQNYLSDTGIVHFSAKEMISPNHKDIARRLGFRNFLPKQEWWERGAALGKIADEIRKLVGAPVNMRNWWRPAPYNKKVGGANGSDHVTALGIDLDYRSSNHRRIAERFLKQKRRENPWLKMSLGLGGRTTHIGILTKRGQREWKYNSYRP